MASRPCHGGQGVTWLLDGPVKSERGKERRRSYFIPWLEIGRRLAPPCTNERGNRTNGRLEAMRATSLDSARGGGRSGWEKYSLHVKVEGKCGGETVFAMQNALRFCRKIEYQFWVKTKVCILHDRWNKFCVNLLIPPMPGRS